MWGWAKNTLTARILAVHEILHRARADGVLAQAISLGLRHPAFQEENKAKSFFDSLLLDPELRLSWAQPLSPLSIFSKLKWKSVETGPSRLLKWREVIAFCAVPLKRYSNVIGRCLHLIVNTLYHIAATYGFPLMVGTRDFARTCTRLSSDLTQVTVVEKDMEDMYWSIPKHEVLKSFTWALKHIAKHRGHTITYFAIHKGGDKILDRLGKTSDDYSGMYRQALSANI